MMGENTKVHKTLKTKNVITLGNSMDVVIETVKKRCPLEFLSIIWDRENHKRTRKNLESSKLLKEGWIHGNPSRVRVIGEMIKKDYQVFGMGSNA